MTTPLMALRPPRAMNVLVSAILLFLPLGMFVTAGCAKAPTQEFYEAELAFNLNPAR